MRHSTIERRAAPIIAWIRDEYRRTGYHPRLATIWYRCCRACARDDVGKQRENARQLINYVASQDLTIPNA